MQEFRKVVGFISPMGEITSRRASPYLLLVYEKNKLRVSADMNYEVLRRLRNLEQFPKMQNNTISLGCAGRSYPLCFPQSTQSLRGKLG
jgi:hypothetical protein